MINNSTWVAFLIPSHPPIHVFHLCTDTEDSEVKKLEELHKRRNQLAAFCKLIVHGILEMSMAAEVYMCYLKVTEVNVSAEVCSLKNP